MLKLIAVAWISGAVCYASRELGCWATGGRDPRDQVRDDIMAMAVWPAFALVSLYLAACRLARRP